MNTPQLVDRVRAGDRRALARAITLVENGAPQLREIMAGLAPHTGHAQVVGFTGSKIWKTVAMFPPVPASVIDAGYEDFATRWNPILDVFDAEGVRFAHEVHPSEIAYDYWTSVRTLEAIDHRPIAEKERPCIGFAITDAPLRFTGPLGQRLTDILGA